MTEDALSPLAGGGGWRQGGAAITVTVCENGGEIAPPFLNETARKRRAFTVKRVTCLPACGAGWPALPIRDIFQYAGSNARMYEPAKPLMAGRRGEAYAKNYKPRVGCAGCADERTR